jgi:hypothetical protein
MMDAPEETDIVPLTRAGRCGGLSRRIASAIFTATGLRLRRAPARRKDASGASGLEEREWKSARACR